MNKKFNQYLFVFAFSLLLWLLLVGSLSTDELLTGCLVSIVAAAFTVQKTTIFSAVRLHWKMPVSLIAYLLAFYRALVIANFDMARRVVSPSLPINPGMVRVSTQLESDLAKMLLANSITLTPGTLSVDIENNEIIVHWIDCGPGTDTETATRHIAADFEKHIRGFLL